eukprot:5922055-Pleurochrysis_carterae.AAC.3
MHAHVMQVWQALMLLTCARLRHPNTNAHAVNVSSGRMIGVPLVWRYSRVAAENRVLIQFKPSLDFKGTFLRSEWGPYIDAKDTRNNPATGCVEEVKVLRSDPQGVQLMHHYPNVEDDPGPEAWLPKEKWSFDRVFHDVMRWVYDDPEKGHECRKEWEALRRWHHAYSEASSVEHGVVHRIGEKLLYGGAPVMSWHDMWALLDSHVPDGSDDQHDPRGAAPPAAASGAPEERLRGNALREHLSGSMRRSELNVVLHPGFTAVDARRAALEEQSATYIEDNFEKQGALFLLHLGEAEGEFSLGLARRTFDETKEEKTNGEVRVWWYQRVSSNSAWGSQPAFKPCMKSERGTRHGVPYVEAVPRDAFLNFPVQLTKNSAAAEDLPRPVLTKNCMLLLRKVVGVEEEEEDEGGEDEAVGMAGCVPDSSDEETDRIAAA